MTEQGRGGFGTNVGKWDCIDRHVGWYRQWAEEPISMLCNSMALSILASVKRPVWTYQIKMQCPYSFNVHNSDVFIL